MKINILEINKNNEKKEEKETKEKENSLFKQKFNSEIPNYEFSQQKKLEKEYIVDFYIKILKKIETLNFSINLGNFDISSDFTNFPKKNMSNY